MDATNQIIIVEDDERDFELITHALERAGCHFAARRVDSQEELNEELFRLAPDLVVSDHAGATWNSFSVLQQVRAFEETTPFVVVSGHLDPQTGEALRGCGVDACVPKDRLAELGPTVQSVLRRHEELRRQRVAEIRRTVVPFERRASRAGAAR